MNAGLRREERNGPSKRPVILTFIGHYLPGYKAGGILRITVNTVDHLCDDFEFRIVTRDHDLGEAQRYPGVETGQWQKVGNAKVNYLPPQSCTIRGIMNVIDSNPHDILYLNSYFDPLTIKTLANRRFRKTGFKPVIVAPWGEFGWASLKQKYAKKFLFICAAKLWGLYRNVTWRASSEFEKADIMKVMGIRSEEIRVIGDLPIKDIPDASDDALFPLQSDNGVLRVVFLSRISREKNLDYALRILRRVKAKVLFDIYGPAENEAYWRECQELIRQLPSNVKAEYLGRVEANQVVNVFGRYDLFLFPTGGEAYGHVIAECLTAGTPVLLSTETPWRGLRDDGLGWDIDLTQEDSFVEVIEKHALLSYEERRKMRSAVRRKTAHRLLDPKVLEANRQLFRQQLAC